MKSFDNATMQRIQQASPTTATEKSGCKGYPMTPEKGFLSWKIEKGLIQVKYSYQAIEPGGCPVSVQITQRVRSIEKFMQILHDPTKTLVAA